MSESTEPVRSDAEQEVRRQGGPTRTPGAITTTGGRAGPAMRHATGQRGEATGGEKKKVAPTTTGDATTGGMGTPTGGTTSDASTGGDPASEAESD
jgi:hypothetical protein